jgi:hypothetical protein
MMNIKEGNVSRNEVAKSVRKKEDELDRATNNDSNKRLAHYWDGIEHPETGEHLKSDFELHDKDCDVCYYAQFSDKKNNSYHYIEDSEKTVAEQVNEDRELAKELEQDRGVN